MSCCVLTWTERGKEERTGLGTRLNVDLHLCRYSEKSKTKCIGITIETRPDYCLKKHLRFGSLFLPPSPPFCLPPLSSSFSLPPSLPPSLSSRPLILHIPPSLLRPSYFFSFLPCKYLSPPSLTFLLSSLSLTFLLSPLSLTFLLPPPSYLPVRCSPMAALDLR